MLYYFKKHIIGVHEWRKWADKDKIDGKERLGVYMLSIWQVGSTPNTDLSASDIIYIGEAHGATKSLQQRLKEFQNVASGKANNHSGAITFREKGLRLEDMWVRAFPVPELLKEDDITRASVLAQLLERELLWNYYEKNGRLPECNKK